jgi:hypothetical protein
VHARQAARCEGCLRRVYLTCLKGDHLGAKNPNGHVPASFTGRHGREHLIGAPMM